MARFASKYMAYSILLRGGHTKFIEGNRVDTEPISADFHKGILDTESQQIKDKLVLLDWTEDKLLKFLRQHKSFGRDFWELEKPAVQVQDLLNEGVRGLDELLEDVNSIDLLKNAIQAEKAKGDDARSTAISKFKKRLKELTGELEEI